MDSAEGKKIFKEKGYLHFKNYFSSDQLDKISKISYKSLQRLS